MRSAPIILYIDTATERCSVCLTHGEVILAHRLEERPRQHLSRLSPMIEECLIASEYDYQDLSAIGVSSGPGSYTGLRAGYATAKGLCLALDIPLVEVPTLESIAMTIRRRLSSDNYNLLYPMIDAGRDDICTSTYTSTGHWLLHPPHHVKASDWLDHGPKGIIAGGGRHKVADICSVSDNIIVMDIDSDALHMIIGGLHRYQHGVFADLAYAEPSYMKPPYITTPKRGITTLS